MRLPRTGKTLSFVQKQSDGNKTPQLLRNTNLF
jgi:hypothetical protein